MSNLRHYSAANARPTLRPLILLCSLVSLGAAEIPSMPDGFWVLPSPDWMAPDSSLASVATIREVSPGKPAQAIHLVPGDIVTSTGGLHAISEFEVLLGVRLSDARADDRGEYQREGRTTAIHLPAFSAWGRWGILLKDDNIPVPEGLTAEQSQTWSMLPARVRMVALRHIPGPNQTWLDALLRLYTAVRDGSTPPPIFALPDPYLRRVAAWWQECAAAKGLPPPINDPGEALFRAAHIVWPSEPPVALGLLHTGDADADRLLAVMAGDGQVDARDCNRVANNLANNGLPAPAGIAGVYLGQCLAAVISREKHGGWPYRSSLVFEAKDRLRMLSALDEVHDPNLRPIVALGRIGPAVLNRDEHALLSAIDTIRQTSPWLAHAAFRIACYAAGYNQMIPWLTSRRIMDGDPPLTRMTVLRLRVYEQYNLHMETIFCTNPPTPLMALSLTWDQTSVWLKEANTGRQTSLVLDRLLYAIAADPTGYDPESVPILIQQMLLTGYGTRYREADTIATAFGRIGRFDDALNWEQAAIALIETDKKLEAKDRDAARAMCHENFRLISLHKPMGNESVSSPLPTDEAVTGGRRTGVSIDGKRCRVWRTTSVDGIVKEEVGYHNGELSGRWVVRSDDGSLRWSGFLIDASRVGWWRMGTGDRGMATGWYNGVNGGSRCGWWRVYGSDGVLLREGLCQDGRPVAPWRRFAADGTSMPLPPEQAALPDDPQPPKKSSTSVVPGNL